MKKVVLIMIVHEQLGIYKIKLPLPFRLNHVNCYAIRGSEGWSIIDTGLNIAQTRQIWQQFMSDKGITNRNVQAIYVTHFHADHFGAAGWLQEITGVPVFISSVEWKSANMLCRVNQSGVLYDEIQHALKAMFSNYGIPENLSKEMTGQMGALSTAMQPFPEVTPLNNGGIVKLGDYHYRIIFTPGHSDGHICFFNEEFGVLISGDHLLPKITSNISLWPDSFPDPLKNYLQSLQKNLLMPIQLVLPAHGDEFSNVKERVYQLQAHHVDRLKLMKGLADNATVFNICKKVFSEKLNIHELRFATTETAAHLMYLVYQDQLEVSELKGVSIFSKKKSKR